MLTTTELQAVNGEAAIKWAQQHNTRTLSEITNNPKFAQLYKETLAIYESKDKLPGVSLSKEGILYNFWQDDKNVRGIYRSTTLDEFVKPEPKWEILLDLDELAKQENENWVWGGSDRLYDNSELVLIRLSRGGSDSAVLREYDLVKRQFVTGGFYVPDSKSHFSWIDRDTIFVSTAFGPDSMTESSYPRTVRYWQRGESLEDAKEVFSVEKSHISAAAFTINHPENAYHFFSDCIDFRANKLYRISDLDTFDKIEINKPLDSDLVDIFEGKMLLILRSDWRGFGGGSLVIMDFPVDAMDLNPKVELLMAPNIGMAIETASSAKNYIIVDVNENVSSQVYKIQKVSGAWVTNKLNYPTTGSTCIGSISVFTDQQLVYYSDHITPSRLLLAQYGEAVEILKQAPARFNASGMKVEQWHAVSADGTSIPYFIIQPTNMQLDGKNPTLLYGYGGFEDSMLPGYLGVTGKSWLEAGNVYVVANIRGGGEFGPKWHQAALRENRQVAFDDFIAVAENLIARGITSPAHLGIEGGSNGGLLVAAVMVQRPELFNAVICDVPLIDMLNYHKLDSGAGASWVDEFGDPDEDAVVRAAIEKYSPLHNLKSAAEIKYPVALITSSINDDRVHPYHARVMVHKLQEMGHSVLYYENHEGGHGGASNLKQHAHNHALSVTYLFQRLCAHKLQPEVEVTRPSLNMA